MNQEVIPVRSKNNNVFYYSDYWHTWSRILFHDAGGRGMMDFRKRYKIPNNIMTVSVDLTPINGFRGDWKEVQRTNEVAIHRHNTFLSGKVTGSIPQEVYEEMKIHYSERTLNLLLHGDYLPLLDFDKAKDKCNETFAELFMEPESFNSYYAGVRFDAGPGVFEEDVRGDYDRSVARWNKRIADLTPVDE